jgi:ABC-2 type transport system permease protein
MRRRNLANIYAWCQGAVEPLARSDDAVLIVYVFTASVYTKATSMPETLHNAPIAIVDEDNSALSQRIASAFYPPQFTPPAMIDYGDDGPGHGRGAVHLRCWSFRPTSSATCWRGDRLPCSSMSTPPA